MSEEEMIAFFTKAAEQVRRLEKTAASDAWSSILSAPGYLIGGAAGLALAPATAALTGNLGYAAGQGIRRLREGYVPTPEETHLKDEAAEYDSAIEEIKQRILLNRIRTQQNQAPSNRRMF